MKVFYRIYESCVFPSSGEFKLKNKVLVLFFLPSSSYLSTKHLIMIYGLVNAAKICLFTLFIRLFVLNSGLESMFP